MKAGITVDENATLRIFGEPESADKTVGSGKLLAEINKNKDPKDQVKDNTAVIGGTEDNPNTGDIIIKGGELELQSVAEGLGDTHKEACLGGGKGGSPKSVQIFGGTVKASCQANGGAGIGGGDDVSGGTINIRI